MIAVFCFRSFSSAVPVLSHINAAEAQALGRWFGAAARTRRSFFRSVTADVGVAVAVAIDAVAMAVATAIDAEATAVAVTIDAVATAVAVVMIVGVVAVIVAAAMAVVAAVAKAKDIAIAFVA